MRRLLIFLLIVGIASGSIAGRCQHCQVDIVDLTDNFCPSCGGDLNLAYDFSSSQILSQLPEAKSDLVTPFKIAVINALSIPSDMECTTCLLDVGALTSNNYSVYGVSVAGLSGYSQEASGIICGGCVLASKEYFGVLVAGLAIESRVTKGLAVAGLGCAANELYGVQISAVNRANKMRGVQIGLFNKATEDICGVQIGLFNMIGRDEKNIVPLINFRF